jgi:hypothetical protein
MWVVHGRLVTIAEELRIPSDMHAKMTANILFDFLISLFPILGAIFAWMNACSTRNAAMVDTWIRRKAELEQQVRGPFALVDETAPSKRSQTGVPEWRMKPSRVGAQQSGIVGSGTAPTAPSRQAGFVSTRAVAPGAGASTQSGSQQRGFISESGGASFQKNSFASNGPLGTQQQGFVDYEPPQQHPSQQHGFVGSAGHIKSQQSGWVSVPHGRQDVSTQQSGIV